MPPLPPGRIINGEFYPHPWARTHRPNPYYEHALSHAPQGVHPPSGPMPRGPPGRWISMEEYQPHPWARALMPNPCYEEGVDDPRNFGFPGSGRVRMGSAPMPSPRYLASLTPDMRIAYSLRAQNMGVPAYVGTREGLPNYARVHQQDVRNYSHQARVHRFCGHPGELQAMLGHMREHGAGPQGYVYGGGAIGDPRALDRSGGRSTGPAFGPRGQSVDGPTGDEGK